MFSLNKTRVSFLVGVYAKSQFIWMGGEIEFKPRFEKVNIVVIRENILL